MDTFIVRVYQRGRHGAPDDDCLTGVVEEISTGARVTFRDCGQLLSVLHRQGHELPGEPRDDAATAPRATVRSGVDPAV